MIFQNVWPRCLSLPCGIYNIMRDRYYLYQLYLHRGKSGLPTLSISLLQAHLAPFVHSRPSADR